MKKLLLLSLIFSIASPSFAATLDDINMAKQPAYRLGISDVPEKEYIEAKESRVEKIAKEYVRKDEGTTIQISKQMATSIFSPISGQNTLSSIPL